MNEHTCAVVILAAGLGTRMRSPLPKAMHKVGGLPMVSHVLKSTNALSPSTTVVVVGPDMEMLVEEVSPARTAVQTDRLGTADAVKAAKSVLQENLPTATVLIVYGDSPFLTDETMHRMLTARADGAGVVVLGFEAADPTNYGRLIMNDDGGLDAIVEHREATEEQRTVTFCNSGVMAVDGASLFGWLDKIDNNNAKGEYYLTDLVAIAREEGRLCTAIEAPEAELFGVDSKSDLAMAEAQFQDHRRSDVLADGVTLLDPTTVWFSHDTVVGPGAEIGRNVVFGPGVSIEQGAEVRDFCHLEGVTVRTGAQVGPFARLRPGTEIGSGARVGNFVEIKNAVLGEGAKANHLSYVGDASIGGKANIGAGTITCNYDGFLKSKTVVGEGAFIGSNSSLVAPVSIGDGAIVGAGSTVTEDVDADAIAVARGRQVSKEGAAKRFREDRAAKKAAQSKN